MNRTRYGFESWTELKSRVEWQQASTKDLAAKLLRPNAAPHRKPKQGSMNTAVVRAGIVNVPVLLWNFAVLTTGSCENACTGCSTSF